MEIVSISNHSNTPSINFGSKIDKSTLDFVVSVTSEELVLIYRVLYGVLR